MSRTRNDSIKRCSRILKEHYMECLLHGEYTPDYLNGILDSVKLLDMKRVNGNGDE